MITPRHRITRKIMLTLLTTTTTMVVMLAGTIGVAQATPPPVKLVLSNHITNGFSYSKGVAVNEDPASPEQGDIYVTEQGNHRVQVLSATGAFVEMFGEEVNKTTKENICTAASHDPCQAGVDGATPGQFSVPESIAIDPSSGDVYVAEFVFANGGYGLRVQEFTAEGEFVLEIGKEVNTTRDKEQGASEAEKNLCSAVEIEKGGACGGPAQEVVGSSEDGAFDFEQEAGDLLAVGGTGSKDLLYVGDEHRVQEFEASGGKWVGEIPLTSISNERESRVKALALDQETGDLYLNYAGPSMNSNVIREFDPEDNKELASFPVNPRETGNEVSVGEMALDPSGRLAVTAQEHRGPNNNPVFGSLYDAASGRRVTEFVIPSGVVTVGVGFSGAGDLYVTGYYGPGGAGEVLAYAVEPIGELTVGGYGCAPGVESDTSATFSCTLKGEVNPEGVPGTETLFEYGRTPNLGEKTMLEKIGASGPVHAVVSVRPNETYYYGLAGFDENVVPPEAPFVSEQASLTTQTVAPRVGVPSVVAVRPFSAVLFGELNPENAGTEYFFEYAQGEQALAACTTGVSGGCAGVQSTPLESSAVYGKIGAKAEITGLVADTTYRYRLFAEDESRIHHGERFHAIGPEAVLTTEPTPLPSAQTGAYSTVTSTSAVISGAVNPDGAAAGYAFELGVYHGAGTQYTIVYSAAAGSGSTPVEESLPVTGLQPGTTYAYRIAVSSGEIANESHALQGEPVTFTTAGTPSVLAIPVTPALLAIPVVAFPAEAPGTTVTKTLSRAQKLTAALKACKQERSKAKRTKCKRAAHRSYGPLAKKKKGKHAK